MSRPGEVQPELMLSCGHVLTYEVLLQIKDRVNAVVDQAQHDFNQGDELVSVAIPQMR